MNNEITCKICKETKKLINYAKNGKLKSGLIKYRKQCKKCRLEKHRDYFKKYYVENKEKYNY